LNAAASTDSSIQNEEISVKCPDIQNCRIDKEPNNDVSLAINTFDEINQKCNGDDIIKSVKASFKSIYDTSSNTKSVISSVSPDNGKPSMENSSVLLTEESRAFTDFTQKTKKTPPSRSKASQKQKEESKVVLTVKERGQIKRTSHLNTPASNASFNIEIFKEKPTSLPSIEKELLTFKQTELNPDKLSKDQELNKKKANICSIYDKLELENISANNKSSKNSSSNLATSSISSQSVLRSSPRKKIKRN
jgi:hypothetical protein